MFKLVNFIDFYWWLVTLALLAVITIVERLCGSDCLKGAMIHDHSLPFHIPIKPLISSLVA
jgi:hypothetical protein